jgi:hypothetical protein
MYLKTVSRKIVISGTLLIWAIKFLLRPFVHIPHEWKPLVGLAPKSHRFFFITLWRLLVLSALF